MKLNEIKKLEVFTMENPERASVNISVNLVYRGNFNDERLIDSKKFVFADMVGKPLEWFDLYLGKFEQNTVKLAFAYVNKKNIYFLMDDGGKIKAIKKHEFSHYFSDDYDEKYIISTQIW